MRAPAAPMAAERARVDTPVPPPRGHMTAVPLPSDAWVAIASGALDVSASEMFADGADILVLPAEPGEPFCLTGDGARMWRRLVEGPVTPADEAEREMLDAMTALSIASPVTTHPARVTHVDPPRLSSPLHELTYAVTARVAAAAVSPACSSRGRLCSTKGSATANTPETSTCGVRPRDGTSSPAPSSRGAGDARPTPGTERPCPTASR